MILSRKEFIDDLLVIIGKDLEILPESAPEPELFEEAKRIIARRLNTIEEAEIILKEGKDGKDTISE